MRHLYGPLVVQQKSHLADVHACQPQSGQKQEVSLPTADWRTNQQPASSYRVLGTACFSEHVCLNSILHKQKKCFIKDNSTLWLQSCVTAHFKCDIIIVGKGLSFPCMFVCAEPVRNETRPSAVMQSKLSKALPKAIDHTQGKIHINDLL